MHFHFCQKYECLGAKNVVLHRPRVQFGLGTVSCRNALLPSGRNVTSTNTGEAATIRQPEEHPGLLMASCWFPPNGSIPPQFPKCSVFPPKTCKFPPGGGGGACGPRLRITALYVYNIPRVSEIIQCPHVNLFLYCLMLLGHIWLTPLYLINLISLMACMLHY